jgi:hypothetical protein
VVSIHLYERNNHHRLGKPDYMESPNRYVVLRGTAVVSEHAAFDQAVRDAARSLRQSIETRVNATVEVRERDGRLLWRECGVAGLG